MNKFLAAILLVTAFSVCAAKKATKQPSVTYVKMERTACFGQCPTYAVEVYDNGLVRYTGRQFVKYSGPYEKNIGSAKTKAVLKEFAQYRVDTCKTVYESMIADLPGVYLTLTINGKTKEIANAHFGPKFFIKLAKDVDDIAQPDGTWKKLPETKQPQ